MFNFLKKDKIVTTNNTNTEVNITPLAVTNEFPNQTNKISLRKDIILDEVKKQNIGCDKARIVFILDHSGSMSHLYNDGTVQEVLERVFPLAMAFDDNSQMEFYLFSDSYKELPSVTSSNLTSYVQKNNLSSEYWGCTSYTPVIGEIYKRYVKKQPSDIPTYVLFITDGDNSDKSETVSLIKKCSKHNIFWKFIGIGTEEFSFLERLDEMWGRTVDNADFIKLSNINNISDAELYKLFMQEYGSWIKACKAKGILK